MAIYDATDEEECPLQVVGFHILVAESERDIAGGYIWAKMFKTAKSERGKLVFYNGSKHQPSSNSVGFRKAEWKCWVPYLEKIGGSIPFTKQIIREIWIEFLNHRVYPEDRINFSGTEDVSSDQWDNESEDEEDEEKDEEVEEGEEGEDEVLTADVAKAGGNNQKNHGNWKNDASGSKDPSATEWSLLVGGQFWRGILAWKTEFWAWKRIWNRRLLGFGKLNTVRRQDLVQIVFGRTSWDDHAVGLKIGEQMNINWTQRAEVFFE
jgi:hypothetical protein